MVLAAIEHYQFWEVFSNRIFWCSLGGWLFASVIKMIIAAVKTREFDFVYLIATGGMPSSHSATVTSAALSIGFTSGFNSSVTALAMVFAAVTMFDAATVRRAAGEHAKVLNAIVRDIKELKFKPAKRFKELLGHTRSEVMWGMATGIVWATLFCWIFD